MEKMREFTLWRIFDFTNYITPLHCQALADNAGAFFASYTDFCCQKIYRLI